MYSTLTTEEKRKEYDPAAAYDRAMQSLETVRANMPAYEDRYGQQLRELYDQIASRPQFSYNAADDALYQGYKNSFAQQGQLAMQHTMGQAAALTGGYGSSYAQSVGQQQYGAYLQKLNEVFPETYAMAYRQYLNEGDALREQYDLTAAARDLEYSRYLDQLNAYYDELGYLTDEADKAYDRGVAAEETAYEREQDAQSRRDQHFARLVDMMLTMGYVPDGAEMEAAGMTDKEMNAYLYYYNTTHGVGGGGGGRRRSGEDSDSGYAAALASARKALEKGVSVEEINGTIAVKVEDGIISVEDGRRLITELTNAAYR